MRAVLSTAGLPTAERFEFWREMLSQQAMPLEAQSRYQADFGARLHATELGPVRLVITENKTVDVARGPALIRRGDPEQHCLVMNYVGHQRLGHDRALVPMGPGDLVLVHTSRPMYSVGDPHRSGQRGGCLLIQPDLLPFPARRLDPLVGRGLSSADSMVGLVSRHLLALGTGEFHPDDAARLAAVTTALLALMLARQLDNENALPVETRTDALVARVRMYIVDKLGDPTLSAESIAAAHHVSVRTLHRLFREHHTTVAGWIRRLRLERSRADLVDPRYATRSVQAIAYRWGFVDPSHFSRLYRSYYGVSPTTDRANHTPAQDR